jgi:hypothetical protein
MVGIDNDVSEDEVEEGEGEERRRRQALALDDNGDSDRRRRGDERPEFEGMAPPSPSAAEATAAETALSGEQRRPKYVIA